MRIETVVLHGHDETVVLSRKNEGIDVACQNEPRNSFSVPSADLANRPEKVDEAAGRILKLLDAFENDEDRQIIVDSMETMALTIN